MALSKGGTIILRDESGNSNRLILFGGLAWVGLVLLNWGMSFFVV